MNQVVKITFPETNIASENQWLEDEISCWDGLLVYRGHISFREGMCVSPHFLGFAARLPQVLISFGRHHPDLKCLPDGSVVYKDA